MKKCGDEEMANVIVLIKQVPDIEHVKFDTEEGRIDRSSAEAEINPFDLNALEAAVQIKEKLGGKVTAISMGPLQAESALRDALARGADRAILLVDKKFAGADTRATSFTLASAIKRSGEFDLIVCGEKTIDGDTGQVGPEVAGMLEIPHIAYASNIKKISDEGLEVRSELWDAYYLKRMKLPGLITLTKDVNNPRLASLRGKMNARKAKVEKWGREEFKDIPLEEFGLKGSHTQVKRIELPKAEERGGEIIRGEARECTEKLFLYLKECLRGEHEKK
jgi:electron transfer flavoprotein beta subunit